MSSDKLRKALSKAGIALSWAVHGHLTEDDAKECLEVVDAALAEPVRNCDVGTASAQDERFKNFCLSHLSNYPSCNVDGKCWKCPLFKTKTRCPIAWGQMPYEEGETK